MQTSKLYNENGCYLSACGAIFFDIASNQTSEVVQCFIFTEDFEEAGTIQFINNEIETMSVSINDSEYGGSSTILKNLPRKKIRNIFFYQTVWIHYCLTVKIISLIQLW